MKAAPASTARPSSRSRWAHRIGTALGVAGVAWVVWQVLGPRWELPAGVGRRLVVPIGVAAPVYGGLSLGIAGAWWWLTGLYEARRPLHWTAAVWARTQVAKYLPGNVFHYVGRQALGRQIGLTHETLVASHLLEMVSLLMAAGLIGVGGAIFARSPAVAGVSLPLLVAVTLAGLLVWPTIDAFLRRLPYTSARMAALPRLTAGRILRLLAPALVAHGAFLLGTGLLLLMLLRAIRPIPVSAADVVWIYALAWVAGTLTPGAPGGLGVREAVLTLGLGGVLGDGGAATLALGLRIVTVLGDVVTFGAGMLVRLPETTPPSRPAAD